MTYEEMCRDIKTASLYFMGVFMGEFVHDYEKWYNGVKADYIREFYQRYDWCNEKEASVGAKCYAVMRIIEGNRVMDALEYLFNTEKQIGDTHSDPDDAFRNASVLLDMIVTGKVQLP